MNIENNLLDIPKRIFIVPYRNRPQQKFFFIKYMSYILEDCNDYEIYFIHQNDTRSFNRGATKNIGFIAIKNKYPEHYKNITIIFNDLDILPFYKIFNYETTEGVVKHYYGFKNTLGGIVVMKGGDFEKINGFPCFWGWGMEDNILQQRCENIGLKIDRSTFYNVGSPEILHLFDGISRIISKNDNFNYINEHNTVDGLKTITNLKYSIENKSANPDDNIFTFANTRVLFVNISNFNTYTPFVNEDYFIYDLRDPQHKISKPNVNLKEATNLVTTSNDWKNIPYYPTIIDQKENMVRYLISTGKKVPVSLLEEIQNYKKTINENDSYNKSIYKNSNDNNVKSKHKSIEKKEFNIPNNNIMNNILYTPNLYKNAANRNDDTNLGKQQQTFPNKYSPNYASYIGVKPRAMPSVRIGMGGAY